MAGIKEQFKEKKKAEGRATIKMELNFDNGKKGKFSFSGLNYKGGKNNSFFDVTTDHDLGENVYVGYAGSSDLKIVDNNGIGGCFVKKIKEADDYFLRAFELQVDYQQKEQKQNEVGFPGIVFLQDLKKLWDQVSGETKQEEFPAELEPIKNIVYTHSPNLSNLSKNQDKYFSDEQKKSLGSMNEGEEKSKKMAEFAMKNFGLVLYNQLKEKQVKKFVWPFFSGGNYKGGQKEEDIAKWQIDGFINAMAQDIYNENYGDFNIECFFAHQKLEEAFLSNIEQEKTPEQVRFFVDGAVEVEFKNEEGVNKKGKYLKVVAALSELKNKAAVPPKPTRKKSSTPKPKEEEKKKEKEKDKEEFKKTNTEDEKEWGVGQETTEIKIDKNPKPAAAKHHRPSSSVKAKSAEKLDLPATRYEPLVKDETSVWHEKKSGEAGALRGNKLTVLKGVYGDQKAIEEMLKNILIKVALQKVYGDTKDGVLTFEEVTDAIKSAKDHGGIAHEFDPKAGNYKKYDASKSGIVSSDVKKFENQKKFSKLFQQECEKCGIYSGRLGSSVGLRLTHLPETVVDNLKKENFKPVQIYSSQREIDKTTEDVKNLKEKSKTI
jgi:hypothetical protein